MPHLLHRPRAHGDRARLVFGLKHAAAGDLDAEAAAVGLRTGHLRCVCFNVCV